MPQSNTKKDGKFKFRAGDQVEAFDGTGLRVEGTVDLVATKQRILWIHTPAGDRKLLDATEHTIELCGRAVLD